MNQTSNSLPMSVPLAQRLRFVLVDTSHPGNVGATARAMKTMGFSELVLVNPRYPDVLSHEDAIAFSSGATEVLSTARIVNSLKDALEGCNFSVALSARLREFSPPRYEPRSLASHLQSTNSLRAAVVFGSERYGLSNEQVEKCQAIVSVSTDAEYGSLNLAQAVQIVAYECRMAGLASAIEGGELDQIGFTGDLATNEQIEGMFVHLEQALIEIEFLDQHNPKKLMSRLRRLFARTSLETEEVNILRGIANQLLHHRKRRSKE
jgi:tRNA/rRNA methyltransferase